MNTENTSMNFTLEVDPNYSDTDGGFYDSDYESTRSDDTISLLNSARYHVFENGRRYHGYKEGKYLLPNDEGEKNRMDLLHHCCLLALRGELFIAPVGEDWKPQRILDVGCGSAAWTVDIADLYPDAEVIGVDLSPIRPGWVPPNLTLEVEDVDECETWQYEENSFDFIHVRLMAGSIADWPKLLRRAYELLKPGGWIEVQDVGENFLTEDDSLPPDSALIRWLGCWQQISTMWGREWGTLVPRMANLIKNAEFVEVEIKIKKFPVGTWPKGAHQKELGKHWLQYVVDGAEAMSLAPMTRILGWERREVDTFLVEVYTALRNSKYHTYCNFHFVCGRKPDI
ncbi:hypothetical protein RUND412_002525 [Rhizina undulata]